MKYPVTLTCGALWLASVSSLAWAADVPPGTVLAEKQLLSLLPDEFMDDYRFLLDSEYQDVEAAKVVKAADTLCAYIKCLEEIAAGNKEFVLAKRRLEIMLEERMTPAVQYFIDVFIPSFSLTLDEMSNAAT